MWSSLHHPFTLHQLTQHSIVVAHLLTCLSSLLFVIFFFTKLQRLPIGYFSLSLPLPPSPFAPLHTEITHITITCSLHKRNQLAYIDRCSLLQFKSLGVVVEADCVGRLVHNLSVHDQLRQTRLTHVAVPQKYCLEGLGAVNVHKA